MQVKVLFVIPLTQIQQKKAVLMLTYLLILFKTSSSRMVNMRWRVILLQSKNRAFLKI